MFELRDISFGVGGSRKILDSVSLQVKPGELVVITGPNGSGKSTLAQIIIGIKTPSAGKIMLGGVDITEKSLTERAKIGISYAFQQPVKFKGLTVYDLINVASGELISPEEAGRILGKVGLDSAEYLDREVDSKLSGGELKRIEIASVLAKGGDLMVFDEPEAGIDLWSFADLTKVLKDLHKSGKTIIVISHQERILKIADRILMMEKGKMSELKEAPKVLPKILEVRNEN